MRKSIRPILRNAARNIVEPLERRALLTFGEIEPLFGGGDGIAPAITPFMGESAGVALPLDDGRYYALGGRPGSIATGTDLFIRRYTATGSLDTSFGIAGQTVLPIPGNQGSLAAVLDANGSIVIATSDFNDASTTQTAVVARVLSNGLFDTSFAGIGYRTLNFGGYNDAVAIAMSGSNIVIGGRANMSNVLGTADFAFARLLPNGTLDSTFSGDGIAVVDLGVEEYLSSMAVQPDGKIIGVGYTRYGGGVDFRMVAHRINANGVSDAGFGTGGGWREFNFPGSYEVANSCAIWNDRLYIVGAIQQTPGLAPTRGMVIAMNLSTGTTDSSFNTLAFPTATSGNGYLSFQFDTGTNPRTSLGSVRVERDGRILVAGEFNPTNTIQQNLGLASITPDGSFDTTLGGDGRVVQMQLGAILQGSVQDMALTPDHSVLVVDGENVLRLRGMLDLSYGAGGTSSIDLGGNRFIVVATHVLPDGKTLAALSSRGGDVAFYVARFNADGTLDTSFGNANPIAPGLARIAGTGGLLGEVDYLNTVDMLVEPDGQIVVAGSFARVNTSFVTVLQQVAVGRFHANGSVDTSFGVNGLALVEGDFSNEVVTSIALAPDKSLLVGGYQGSTLADIRPLIVRLTDTGARDLSFDTDGVLSPLFNTVALTRYNTRLMDLAVRPNGNIVYVGSWQSSPTGSATANGMVVELLPTGAPNPGFGFGGFGDAGTGSADRLYAVALQPDGKIVAAGSFANLATVIRVQTNGFYDPAFASGGVATGPAIGNDLFDVIGGVDVLLQPDGKVVASTIVTAEIPGLPGESALWRLNANGSLDTTFQPFDGVGELGKPFNAMIYAIAQQADGKVILGGTGGDLVLRRATAGRFQVISARYMIDGYNGVATYPTVRIKFSEAVNLASVDPADFTVGSTSSLIYTSIPAAHLSWQTTSDPTELDLYYIGPNGPAALVWPKGLLSVSVNADAISTSSGGAVAASDVFSFKTMPADFNYDGAVNFDDLLRLSQNYGNGGRLHAQGDANYDGLVNFDDLLMLSQNYGQSLIAAVPASTTAASTAKKSTRRATGGLNI